MSANKNNGVLFYMIVNRNKRLAYKSIGELLDITDLRDLTNDEREKWSRAEKWILSKGN